MMEKAVQEGQNMGAFPWATRSCTPRELSLRGVAQAPPAMGPGWQLRGDAAKQDSSRRPCFRWKENNGKNKSKDHSDWKSIASLKHNNCNHIYWPCGRVRAHRQDHQLRWIAIAPLTLPLHTWSCPVCSQNGHGIYIFSSFYCTKPPNHFKKDSYCTVYISLILHLTVIHSPA